MKKKMILFLIPVLILSCLTLQETQTSIEQYKNVSREKMLVEYNRNNDELKLIQNRESKSSITLTVKNADEFMILKSFDGGIVEVWGSIRMISDLKGEIFIEKINIL